MELQKIYDDEKLVTAFAESRIGGRPENQDNYGWAQTPFGYLVTVCDGMGGGPGGKTASTIAVREIVDGINGGNADEALDNIIIKAIRRANMAIIEAGRSNPKLRGMGSTCTVLLINERAAYVAHVGDSRVYQLRHGRKVFRTFDHSMVFEMVEQGVITEEQARLSAQSNVITRALGIKPDVEVELHEVPYEKGDRFLLCTDGIHGTMPEKELVKMVSSHKGTLGALTDDIATYVDNLGRSAGGGHDNLTLAIVETKTNSKLKPKMSKQAKIITLALIVLLALSIVINFMQCGSAPKDGQVAVDTTEVKALKDSIDSLQKDLKTIDSLNEQISGTKNQAHVNAIKAITQKATNPTPKTK